MYIFSIETFRNRPEGAIFLLYLCFDLIIAIRTRVLKNMRITQEHCQLEIQILYVSSPCFNDGAKYIIKETFEYMFKHVYMLTG